MDDPAGLFSEQIAEHERRIRLFVIKRVADPHLVEDIVQQTLIQAHQGIRQLRKPDALPAWLTQIARNNLRDHYRRRKDVPWIEQYESAAADVSGQESAALQESFDELLGMLARAEAGAGHLTILILRFAFGWTPREICAVTGGKRNTVYAAIQRMMKRMRKQPPRPLTPEEDSALRFDTAVHLWNAGVYPTSGPGFRNSFLMYQAYAFTGLATERHPEHVKLAMLHCAQAFSLAQFAQFPNDLAPPERNFGRWRRDLWDRELLARGEALYDRLTKAKVLMPADQAFADFFHLLYAPPIHEAVDWAGVQEALERVARVTALSSVHIKLAGVREFRFGAADGIAYLEALKHNKRLSDYAVFHRTLGELLMAVGRWRDARFHLKKFLGWPCSEAFRVKTTAEIAECQRRMKTGSRIRK